MARKLIKNPKLLVVSFFASLALLASGFLAGATYSYLIDPPLAVDILNKDGNRQEVDFSRFWEVWDLLTERYLFANQLDAKQLLYGAISGLASATGDPYTSFLTPEDNQALKDSLNGTYEGIGAELGMDGEQLIVVAPLDGSPAKRAGLLPQDKILAIDGELTAGVTIAEAVSKIRGKAETKVVLTIGRGGSAESVDIEITRGTISIPSIVVKECSADAVCDEKGVDEPVAVLVRISRFGDDTDDLWDSLTGDGQLSGYGKIILDLRGNPGGYLLSPVHIAGSFLERGAVVLWQEDGRKLKLPLKTDRQPDYPQERLIVLIDKGSASASEILASALRDNGRATLVGEQSFGKGTVQEAKDFSDGAGLHITSSKWLTPNKVWVHEKGLAPDVAVEFDEEMFKEGKDTQLQRALEL